MHAAQNTLWEALTYTQELYASTWEQKVLKKLHHLSLPTCSEKNVFKWEELTIIKCLLWTGHCQEHFKSSTAETIINLTSQMRKANHMKTVSPTMLSFTPLTLFTVPEKNFILHLKLLAKSYCLDMHSSLTEIGHE